MTGELDRINASIVALGRMQERIGNTVFEVANIQQAIRSDLAELQRQFVEFQEQDALSKNVQHAQSELITVRQQLSTEFGHYADVRRHATGILQGMDARIVAHDTIRQVTEEIMLATPRYWLSPALVGLASWIRDDRRLAGRGLGEALRRHNDKTSLFFALILRRQRRDDAAVRWLRQYLARQDASELGREFGVVLDATSAGGFGPVAKELILDHAKRWYEWLSQDEQVVEAQVRRWTEFLDSQRVPVAETFEILPTVSPTWPALQQSLEQATAFSGALGFVRATLSKPVDVGRRLEERMDELLTTLVTEFDSDEAPLRKQESELKAVISHGGDVEVAQQFVAATDAAFDSHIDFFTLLTNASVVPDTAGVSAPTQKLAVALCREWIEAAAGRLEAAAIADEPETVELVLDGWSTRCDESASEDEIVADISRHLDAVAERELAAVRFTGNALVAAIGAAVFAVMGLYFLVTGRAEMGVFVLVAAAGAGAWSYSEYRVLPRRRDAIRWQAAERKDRAIETVRGALAELVDIRERTRAERATVGELRAFVRALVPATHATAAADGERDAVAAGPSAGHIVAAEPAAADPDRELAIELPAWDLVPPTEFLRRPGQ